MTLRELLRDLNDLLEQGTSLDCEAVTFYGVPIKGVEEHTGAKLLVWTGQDQDAIASGRKCGCGCQTAAKTPRSDE